MINSFPSWEILGKQKKSPKKYLKAKIEGTDTKS